MFHRKLPINGISFSTDYLPVAADLQNRKSHSQAGRYQSWVTATYAGILLFCILYFFRPADFIPALGFIPLAKFAGLLAGVSLVGAFLSGHVRLIPEIKLVLALFAYLCLGIPGSLWPGGSFELIINGFSKMVVVVVAAMWAITTVKRLRSLVLVQTFAMLTLAILAQRQALQGGRMFGVGNMFADPNDLALNLCIILPFCVAMLLSNRFWIMKLFWTGAATVALLAIVSTLSRGGFLALTAVLLTMCLRFNTRAIMGIILLILSILLIGAVMIGFGKSSYLDRLSTISNPEADASGSAQIRQKLLTRSLEITLRHPILGVGPGQFTIVSGFYNQTHNSYTQLSSEAGIPALIMFLALIRHAFKNLKVFPKTAERTEAWYLARGLYCAMVGYLVGAFFLSTAFWLYPYLLVAYSSGLRRISEGSNISIAVEPV